MANPLMKKGAPSVNPSGMSVEQKAARDLLNADLREPSMYRAWLVAYRGELKQGNAIILRDYADRVGGKPKEQVELSQDPDAPLNPLAPLTLEELKAVARAQLDKEKK